MARVRSVAPVLLLCLSFLVEPSTAAVLEWQGSLTLEVDDLPAIHQPVSGVATVNAGGAGLHVTGLEIHQAIPFSGSAVRSPSTILADPVFFVAPNFAGALGAVSPGVVNETAPGGALRGVLPMAGSIAFCLTQPAPCTNSFALQLTANGTAGAGIGGTVTAQPPGLGLRFSLAGAPWTVETALVTVHALTVNGGLTSLSTLRVGFAHGPASATSSTGQTSGVVQLVTPIAITSDLTTPNASTAAFGTLTVRFIPEPSGFVLPLTAGALTLAILAGRRRRRD